MLGKVSSTDDTRKPQPGPPCGAAPLMTGGDRGQDV
jgi:hypothetical protein